eukprot:6183212-Pleurochrysis_carterae.AAC.1
MPCQMRRLRIVATQLRGNSVRRHIWNHRQTAQLCPGQLRRTDDLMVCARVSLDSHTWASGQDQVAVIKRQLQLCLPGVLVFLDVRLCLSM